MAKISIIVPVYITEKEYFNQCICSLIEQTEKNIEIIIVSDGMSKERIEFYHKFEEKDSRIKLITQENQGVAVARNNGLKNATAPYITFVDADDWVEPEFCRTFLDAFEKNPNVSIVSVAAFLNRGDEERCNPFWKGRKKLFVGEEKAEIELQAIFKEASAYTPPFATFGTTWAKAYNREWLINQNIYYEPELRRGQDTLFNLYAFEKAKNILYLEQYLYHYRVNEGSTVNKYTDNVIEILERISKHIYLFIKTYNKDRRFYRAYYQKSIQLLTQAINCDYTHKDNPKSYWRRRRELKAVLNRDIYRRIYKNLDMKKIPFKRKVYWLIIKYKFVDVIFMLHRIYS